MASQEDDKPQSEAQPEAQPESEQEKDNDTNDTPPEQTKEKGKGNPLSKAGDAAGTSINNALAPVSNTVGRGLETAARPIGGVVDPVVGGVMRSGAAFGDAAGVGAGNLDRKKEDERAERTRPVGGQEQTAGNPLGLSEP